MNSTSSILESFLNYITYLNTPFDFNETNTISAEMPDPPAWVWCSFVLEAVIIIFGGIWTVLSMIILYKHPLFHKNLQVLIVSMLFMWWIMQLSRFVICLAAILFDKDILKNMSIFLVKPPFIYAEKIRIGAASCIMSEMGAVILERIWASINIEFYERSSSISFVSILVLLSWIIGIMCSQLMFYSFFGVCVCMLLILFLIAFIATGYSYIKRVNFRKLRDSKLHSNRYTLSQSYQLKENIRAISILRTIFKYLIGFLSTFLIVFICGIIIQSDSNIYLIRACINILIDTPGPVVFFGGYREVYVWQQDLNELLGYMFKFCRRNVVKPVTRETRKPIENLDGRRLAFDINEEAEIYFKQLKDAWN